MAAVSGTTFAGNSRDRDRDQMNFGPVTAAERAQRSVFGNDKTERNTTEINVPGSYFPSQQLSDNTSL